MSAGVSTVKVAAVEGGGFGGNGVVTVGERRKVIKRKRVDRPAEEELVTEAHAFGDAFAVEELRAVIHATHGLLPAFPVETLPARSPASPGCPPCCGR